MDRTDLSRHLDTAGRALGSASRLLRQAAGKLRSGAADDAERLLNQALECWDTANDELGLPSVTTTEAVA